MYTSNKMLLLQLYISQQPYNLYHLRVVITPVSNTGYTHVLQFHLLHQQVYISECVGVHVVGYVFMVYGAASAMASICVGKLLGHVSITSVSLLNVCLNIGLVSFLLVWERQPNYFVMFTMALLWGICDGSWNSLISSKYRKYFISGLI